MFGFKVSSILTILLVSARLIFAIKGVIQDCDEVFNYWEPLNFLTRYFGKQTWEYSPEYAIRSWTYLVPFAVLTYPLRLLEKSSAYLVIPSNFQFYLVRIGISLLSSYAELNLADSLRYLSPEISNWFLIFQIFNPGMSHASISLLPSTFTLIMGMFSTAAIVDYFKYDQFTLKVESYINQKSTTSGDNYDNDNTNEKNDKDEIEVLDGMHITSTVSRDRYFTMAVFFTAIGGFLGWPFAMVLIVPFLINVFTTLLSRKEYQRLGFYLIVGCAALLGTLAIISQIDIAFYGKTALVPINILLYNVIYSDEETGPNIFGVEPVTYYIFNLLLNFYGIGLLAVLGLGAGIYLRLQKVNFLHIETLVVPSVLWCLIFWSQPHKEERFMYPIYHLITLSAACAAQGITDIFGAKYFISRVYSVLSKIAIFILVSVIATLRITSLINNYAAPLAVYGHLPTQSSSSKLENVCVGREWYHYPSSFFLNSNQRLRFVENGFRGMLPGDFLEPATPGIRSIFNSTSYEPTQYNNKNEYNPELVSPFDVCDYYVDLNMPVDPYMGEVQIFDGTTGESVLDNWSTVYCDEFIDSETSFGLAKLIYIPKEEFEFACEWILNEVEHNEFVNKAVNAVKGSETYVAVTKNAKVLEVKAKLTECFGAVVAKIDELVPQNLKDFVSAGEVHYNKMCLAKKL